MEKSDNTVLNISLLTFIIISIVYVIYSTATLRGLYMDGSYYMLCLLKGFSENNIDSGIYDFARVRFCIQFLLHLPCILSYFLLKIENKTALMLIYSCSLFLYPFLVLFWNYHLTKRTKRFDILFLSLFTYCLVLITFSIFAVSETLMGALLHFVLWNYMAAKTDYKKTDIALIALLIVVMFGTWEYVVFLGPIFFIASFMYASKEENRKNKIIKHLIGFGALSAGIFNFVYLLKISLQNPTSGLYFLKEFYDFIPRIGEMCTLFSLMAAIFLSFAFFKRDKISNTGFLTIFLVNLIILIRLLAIFDLSLNPIYESHLRSIPFWLMPLLFFSLYIYDAMNKHCNLVKIRNYTVIILICGIFQTSWQCIHTFFWDNNIKYMKKEMAKNETPLYIADEHEEISSFLNEELRRYIWWGNYAATSILLTDTHKIKTLVVNYENADEIYCNNTFRETLYVIPEKNLISIPYGTLVPIKTKFWDMTDCAEALDKYNKEHNIETLINKHNK